MCSGLNRPFQNPKDNFVAYHILKEFSAQPDDTLSLPVRSPLQLQQDKEFADNMMLMADQLVEKRILWTVPRFHPGIVGYTWYHSAARLAASMCFETEFCPLV